MPAIVIALADTIGITSEAHADACRSGQDLVLGALDASADRAQRALAQRRAYLGEWARDAPGLDAVQRLWSSATAAAARQAGTLVRSSVNWCPITPYFVGPVRCPAVWHGMQTLDVSMDQFSVGARAGGRGACTAAGHTAGARTARRAAGGLNRH